MKWIVFEENPRPDNYVAVIITEPMKKLKIEALPHSVFSDGDEALAKARQLRDHYGVKMIRIFQSESDWKQS